MKKHVTSFLMLCLNLLLLVSCAEVRENTDSSNDRCSSSYAHRSNLRQICISGVEIAREQIMKWSCRKNPRSCYIQALTYCGASSRQDLRNEEVKACTDGVDFMAQSMSGSIVASYLYTASNVLPFNASPSAPRGESDTPERAISSDSRGDGGDDGASEIRYYHVRVISR